MRDTAAPRIASLLAMFVLRTAGGLRWCAGMALMAVLAACGGGGGSAPLADAESRKPSCIGYDHVYLTVQRVRVLQQVDGVEQWAEVALAAPRRIDLMNSGGLLQALGAAPLAAGHYTELRLIVAASDDGSLANAAQPIGGNESALNVPSGAQDGLKLMGDFVVPTGQTGDVVLSGFDACQAVTQAGNSGKFNLKPELSAGVQLAGAAAETRIASGSVTAVIGGGYVISRVEESSNVHALQRYGADGQPVGPEATITMPLGMFGSAPRTRIAPLVGGGYGVVWLSLVEPRPFPDVSIYELFTQGFTATGAPIGSPVLIGQVQPDSWGERSPPRPLPQVAGLAGGGYAVVWAGSTARTGIHVQRFNADGTPAGAAQNVSPVGGSHLGITGLSTGGYLVTWGLHEGFEGGVRAYSSTDVPLGPAHSAGARWGYQPENTGPGVAAPLAGGGAILAWQYWVRAAYIQQLAPDGTPLTSPRVADGAHPGFAWHTAPAAAGLPDGGYVVVWIENETLLNARVHALRYAADGTLVGPVTRINLVTTLPQKQTAVVPMAGGGFMITWSGVGADGTRGNYARVFPANGLLGTP
jgi:hypothetical protein